MSTGIVLWVLRWLRSKVSPQHHHLLVVLICGACLGIVPSMGSFITSRLAMPASIAFAALFATVLSVVLSELAKARRLSLGGAGLVLIAAVISYVHGYRAYAQSEATVGFYAWLAQSRTHWALSPPLDENKPAPFLVMIASADANDAAYTPFVRARHGRALLRGLRILSGSPAGHALTRIDDRTLELRVSDDFGLSTSVVGSFTRGESDVLHAGEQVRVASMEVTVLQTQEGQPTHMRVRFGVPLESELLAFVHSTAHGLERLVLPAPGDTVQLPPPVMPNLALLAGPTP